MKDGLKSLFALYRGAWWENDIPDAVLSYAKEAGFVFDYPEYESHPDALRRLHSILEQIDPRDIANAFLFSLSTHRLEYRSALGSYFYASAIPEHEFMNSHNETLAAAADHCYLCGWNAWKPNEHPDIRHGTTFHNYERYRYGGSCIGSLHLNYALFDLEQFLTLPKVVPTPEDKRIFAEILACVDGLKASDKAGKLRDAIRSAGILKATKDELSVLLGMLGVCGILAGEDFPAYDVRFANEYERDPSEYRNDFAYPINRWHARDGINTQRLAAIFGEEFLSIDMH